METKPGGSASNGRRAAAAAEALARAARASMPAGVLELTAEAARNAGSAEERAVLWAEAALTAESVCRATLGATGVPEETVRQSERVRQQPGEFIDEYARRMATMADRTVRNAARAKIDAAAAAATARGDRTKADACRRASATLTTQEEAE